ncbi:MAG: TolC family protein [Lentimicrobiaceae bacterium]|nr:TolC family protein [Lentimicrobiaceae bacterium]
MKKIISFTFFAVVLTFGMQTISAQRVLTYTEYVKNVREKNIEYLVERYNISIAEANARAARVMPDPEFSFNYENNQDWNVQMGQVYSAELGYTLELGGKRRARIAAAKSEQQMTEALVEDFFRNLRADATLFYLEALKQKQLAGLALSSYQSMRALAHADSLRHAVGEISEVDAMQSRLETNTMMSDYFQAEMGYRNMLFDLVVFEGGTAAIDSISGELSLIIRTYQLPNLIDLAQDNRADLRAAIRGRELSAANLRLAKANRIIDLGLNIGFAHNTVALNEEAPAPRFNAISAGISIPLKFSSINRGELQAAQYSEQQAAAQYDMVLLQIRKEVEQSYNNYLSASRRAELYQNSILADATTILERKKYSYSRGEASLLEVLDAQRTANDVFQSYYEMLYNANASLVELCRAVGVWDLEF